MSKLFFTFLGFLSLSRASLGSDLAVTVFERETDTPLANALVQIGPAPDDPFVGNYALTALDGTVSFSDPNLGPGLPLTVAADGHAYFTVFDCPTGNLSVWCNRVVGEEWPDTSIVSGVVTSLPIVDNDDSLDAAIVFPSTSLQKMLTGGWSLISPFTDTMHVGFPIGDIPLPENFDIPSQTEYWFLNFFKEPYKRRFRTNDTINMLCLGYRISLADMTSGGGSLIPTRATAERDYLVVGDATVDFSCTVDFLNNIDVSVSNLPSGSQGIALTVGELSLCPRNDKFFPINQAGCRPEADTTVTLPTLPTIGPFTDLLSYAGIVYTDTADAAAWGGGAFDWAPLGPGDTRNFDRFYSPPQIIRIGNTFYFSEYQTSGTPEADYVMCRFNLEDQSTAGNDTLAWEMVAPGEWDFLTLPELSTSAPGWGALPDPSVTAADDQLRWGCYMVSSQAMLQEFLSSPLRNGALFSYRSADAPPLRGPHNLRVEIVDQVNMELLWDPEEMANSYIVRWYDCPWGQSTGEAETAYSNYQDTNALPIPGSQRYYRLISHTDVSYSEPTDPVGGSSWEIEDGRQEKR